MTRSGGRGTLVLCRAQLHTEEDQDTRLVPVSLSARSVLYGRDHNTAPALIWNTLLTESFWFMTKKYITLPINTQSSHFPTCSRLLYAPLRLCRPWSADPPPPAASSLLYRALSVTSRQTLTSLRAGYLGPQVSPSIPVAARGWRGFPSASVDTSWRLRRR